MAMVYQWSKGAQNAGIAAQVAGEEIERVRANNHGRLTPSALVDASKSKKAPLHKAFQWDDTIAAREYRNVQARNLINHLVVNIQTEKNEVREFRAFVSIRRDEEPSYTTVQDAMADAALREQVLRRALTSLSAWRRTYQDLSELAKVFGVIDETVQEFEQAS